MSEQKKIRVLLVDDHQMLRDGLRSLLESRDNIRVIGEAGTAEQALRACSEHQPDVVVLDLGLPDKNGLEVIQELKRDHPQIRIVVLSMHISRDHVTRAVEAGADGYVPKSSTHSSLIEALEVVEYGERYLHPRAASALMESLSSPPSPSERIQDLSERELEVVRLTALGLTSRESGLRLEISPKTVDTYRSRAMEKLEIQQRSGLIRFALENGLLDDMLGD